MMVLIQNRLFFVLGDDFLLKFFILFYLMT